MSASTIAFITVGGAALALDSPQALAPNALVLDFRPLSIHAMLGIRSIVRDFDLKPRTIRRIERGLWALGAVTAAYGIVLLSILAARA